MLDAAASKLDKSSGPDLQSLLHGLVLHDVKARQGDRLGRPGRLLLLRLDRPPLLRHGRRQGWAVQPAVDAAHGR